MGLISPLLKWRDDRDRLTKLRFDLEDAHDEFQKEITAAKLKHGSEEWERAYAGYDFQCDTIRADIDEIETAALIRRAREWGVPIPPRPFWSEEPVYDDEYWDWSRIHGKYYLSAKGKALLRREAYAEMEMFYKPWLSWAALLISIVSLMFSVLKR
ncbi:MAG: hypothetical protein E6Q77_08645 [Rhizobium sp.]|nr:MAG: hypothetical protein E6Q77_08645 [Rhizobium sp.]